MDALRRKKCVPCEGGIPPLSDGEIRELLPQVPQWMIVPAPDPKTGTMVNTLQREVKLKAFMDVIRLIQDVAQLAEAEGHHPDFSVHYNHIRFTLWTHTIGGLHDNDFILAAKIDDRIAAYAKP